MLIGGCPDSLEVIQTSSGEPPPPSTKGLLFRVHVAQVSRAAVIGVCQTSCNKVKLKVSFPEEITIIVVPPAFRMCAKHIKPMRQKRALKSRFQRSKSFLHVQIIRLVTQTVNSKAGSKINHQLGPQVVLPSICQKKNKKTVGLPTFDQPALCTFRGVAP